MAKEKPKSDQVRIPKSLRVRIARIAAHRNQSVPAYITHRLTQTVDADEAEMLADVAREREARARGKPDPRDASGSG